jgi:hypothetical protein
MASEELNDETEVCHREIDQLSIIAIGTNENRSCAQQWFFLRLCGRLMKGCFARTSTNGCLRRFEVCQERKALSVEDLYLMIGVARVSRNFHVVLETEPLCVSEWAVSKDIVAHDFARRWI